MHALHLNIDDRGHMIGAQTVEQYDLVQAVQKFGPEMRAHDLHDLRFDLFHILPVFQRGEMLAPQIGCQDDECVGEIDGAALTIGQAAIIQHL